MRPNCPGTIEVGWKDIAGRVSGFAPVIGGLLGGPAGATAGTLIASALGTGDDPDLVAAALKTDPEAAAKIKQAELDHKLAMQNLLVTARSAELAEQTKQQAEVNQTIRAELEAQGGFKTNWRPAVGWVMAASFAGVAMAMCWALIQDPSQLPTIMDGMITLMIAMGAVLGVNIHKRSQDKQMAITGLRPAGLLGSLTGKSS